MSQFIEEISKQENTPDDILLSQLRKDRVAKLIANTVEERAQQYISDNDTSILNQISTEVPDGTYVEPLYLEDFNIKQVQLEIKNEQINYIFNIDIELLTMTEINLENSILHGVINLKGNMNINIERHKEEEEKAFISRVKDDPSGYIICNNIVITNSIYEEFEEEDYYVDDSAYDTCPMCGDPLNYYNDAGDGFCITCSNQRD